MYFNDRFYFQYEVCVWSGFIRVCSGCLVWIYKSVQCVPGVRCIRVCSVCLVIDLKECALTVQCVSGVRFIRVCSVCLVLDL